MTVDLFRRFAYVANVDNAVSAYRIHEDGALTPVAGSPFSAGVFPSSVVADLLGRFVYVANGVATTSRPTALVKTES